MISVCVHFLCCCCILPAPTCSHAAVVIFPFVVVPSLLLKCLFVLVFVLLLVVVVASDSFCFTLLSSSPHHSLTSSFPVFLLCFLLVIFVCFGCLVYLGGISRWDRSTHVKDPFSLFSFCRLLKLRLRVSGPIGYLNLLHHSLIPLLIPSFLFIFIVIPFSSLSCCSFRGLGWDEAGILATSPHRIEPFPLFLAGLLLCLFCFFCFLEPFDRLPFPLARTLFWLLPFSRVSGFIV